MELKRYPRPSKDTGIGMHWSPGNAGAVGEGELKNQWIPQLQRMGVKWVKLLHDGGLGVAELLLKADIMPVVRLYRHRPNSKVLKRATLKREEIEIIKKFIAAGVKYFEFNNEPELANEWERESGPPPVDAIDYVARAAIVDMETILGLGGYPAIPATAIGTQWDLIGKIIEHGGKHLFDEPVWLAVHNYDLNHPLDYPYDAANQRGKPLTPEAYRALGYNAWSGSSWGVRTLAYVNNARSEQKNYGATILEDASSFLAYERLAELSMLHLGRHLPILSTENGPIVGEDPDPRYPTTTPMLHAQKAAEIAKIMMGTSDRYNPAPDYYFCTAFWLTGAAVLRAKGWEGHAWFSPRWTEGHLPAVEAMEALEHRPRELSHEDDEPLPPTIGAPRNSVVSGKIYGHPKTRVILRSSHYAIDSYTDEEGGFRFENLPAGDYRLAAPLAGVVHLGIHLDGENHIELNLGKPETTPPPPQKPNPNWQVEIQPVAVSPGLSIIRVSVQGKKGLPVHISADGWAGYEQRVGSKPEYGPDALEFAPLGPGHYTITPENLGIEAKVNLRSNQVLKVNFKPAEKTATHPVPASSSIQGVLLADANTKILLKGPDDKRKTVTDPAGNFRFENLRAGTYELIVPTLGIHRKGIQVDGVTAISLRLDAKQTPEAQSSISGRVVNGAGLTIVLRKPDGEERIQIGVDEFYAFEGLGPGYYYLRVINTSLRRGGLIMTGKNHRKVNFNAPKSIRSMGTLYGEVSNGAGWQLYLRGPGDTEVLQPLDEKGRFEISGLQAGAYQLILQTPTGERRLTASTDGLNRQSVVFEKNETADEDNESLSEKSEEALALHSGTTSTQTWDYQITEIQNSPGYGIIRVKVTDKKKLPVRIWTDDWHGMMRLTGDKPELAEDTCEFAPLGAGEFFLQPLGLPNPLKVELSHSQTLFITFTVPTD